MFIKDDFAEMDFFKYCKCIDKNLNIRIDLPPIQGMKKAFCPDNLHHYQ